MARMSSNERQYVLDMLKHRYDDLYKSQRDGEIDWAQADEEKSLNKRAQEAILGHSVKRAGYNYI